jgi:superfamily II DNA or RNA helicase
VICPKQQKEDETWQNNAKKFGIEIDLTVISKEAFKKVGETLPKFQTVIIDECHTVLGVTADTRQRKGEQIPKTSQIFEAVHDYLIDHKPERLYFCSATPISKPMNLWAIAILMGQKWDYFDFRRKYYFESRIGMRRIWLPRKDDNTKERLANLIKKFGYTGGLENFFDVPEQTHKEVYVELSKEQKEALKEIQGEADPLVRRARERTIENGVLYAKKIENEEAREQTMVKNTRIYPSKKIDYILERAIEFPKMLIFANYTAQIHEISKALKKEGYNVVELTGATKDRKNLISEADKSKECVVVAQCSISSGYELPSFPCVIMASKGWQYLHYEQGIGRVQRANAIKKNLYIHLIVKGGADEDCHKAIMSGADFQEKLNHE